MITLDDILRNTHARLAEAKSPLPSRGSPSAFKCDFKASLKIASSDFAIIAEIKRSSPSRGDIRQGLDVGELAKRYADAGAAALSVLTEPSFFGGRLQDLVEARDACDLPILRKDFILHEYQLEEAVRYGADAVLLIAGALPDASLSRLMSAAADRGLNVLLEVHDASEIKRITSLKPDLVGVNNRNLKTMEVNPANALKLAPLLPREALWIAESGLKKTQDLVLARRVGYGAFLIGEWLLEKVDPGKALKKLLQEARSVWSV